MPREAKDQKSNTQGTAAVTEESFWSLGSARVARLHNETHTPLQPAGSAETSIPNTFMASPAAPINSPTTIITTAGTSSVLNYQQKVMTKTSDDVKTQSRPVISKSDLTPAKAKTESKYTTRSKADHKATRAHELKAMQELISALDAPRPSPAVVQEPFIRVDPRSMLGIGSDLATPSVE